MGKLRDRMEQDLRLGGYSPATQRIYLLYAREFARYYMRSPADMGEEEIRAYLMHRIERKCSHETYRQVWAGLKSRSCWSWGNFPHAFCMHATCSVLLTGGWGLSFGSPTELRFPPDF